MKHLTHSRRMNEGVVEKAAEVLKALANPTRLRIVELLNDGEMCVSELVDALGVSEPIASQQLNKMKDKNILGSRRRGCMVFYYLKDKQMIDELLDCIVEYCKNNHSK
jgi:DNA-binding transcriptional ArsR family regulator